MKERPILWAPDSVKALLNTRPDGTAIDPGKPYKTVTRRLMKIQPPTESTLTRLYDGHWLFERLGRPPEKRKTFPDYVREIPDLYEAGDRLWGREAWYGPAACNTKKPSEIPEGYPVWYQADTSVRPISEPGKPRPWIPDTEGSGASNQGCRGRYRHSRFMCKWMHRLLHEVVSVRPERLQELTEADAWAEGVAKPSPGQEQDPCVIYAGLWNKLHPDVPWSSNPWIWHIEIRGIER